LPDLFFYRDPEEIEREAAEKAAAAAAPEEAPAAAANAAGDWDAAAAETIEPTAQTLDWSADTGAGDWSADAPAAAGSW